MEEKFLESFNINDWQVDTDMGWKDIEAIGKTIQYQIYEIYTENFNLKCADEHIVFTDKYTEIYVKNLKLNDKIITENGIESIIKINILDEYVSMYDLQLSDNSNRRYYTNGILSHNSLWMNNMSVKLADAGKNVVYVSLEMAKHKCMKRMGSMRLKIPMSEYDEKSSDAIFMKDKINSLKMSNGGIFEKSIGKLFVKKYPTSSCTITELDNYITKLQQVKNIKLDAVVVDYLNIMGLEKSAANNTNNLFLKGKHLAEGLRYIADKHNVLLITATQTDKDVWGASDIDLKDIPESKAVAETADVVWGIIRNLEMKRNNKYRLKIMKLRDGDNKEDQIKFDFNPTYMLIENDEFVTPK